MKFHRIDRYLTGPGENLPNNAITLTKPAKPPLQTQTLTLRKHGKKKKKVSNEFPIKIKKMQFRKTTKQNLGEK